MKVFRNAREAWAFAFGCAFAVCFENVLAMSDQMSRGEVSEVFGFGMIFVTGALAGLIYRQWSRAD